MVSATDDDQFIGYEVSTMDPGPGLLVATTLFCVLLNSLLPCLVSLGRRYEKRRLSKLGSQEDDEVMSEHPNKAPEKGGAVDDFLNGAGKPQSSADPSEVGTNTTGQRRQRHHQTDDDAGSVAPSSFVHGKAPSVLSAPPGKLKTFLDKVCVYVYVCVRAFVRAGSEGAIVVPCRFPSLFLPLCLGSFSFTVSVAGVPCRLYS